MNLLRERSRQFYLDDQRAVIAFAREEHVERGFRARWAAAARQEKWVIDVLKFEHLAEQNRDVDERGFARAIATDEHLILPDIERELRKAAVAVCLDAGNHAPGSGFFLRNAS